MRYLAFSGALLVSIVAGAAIAPALAAQEEQAESTAHIQSAARVVQGAIDASRANDFERWLSFFTTDAVLDFKGSRVVGTDQMRLGYEVAEQSGFNEQWGDVVTIEVMDSGWTGERIFVWQEETYSSGIVIQSYAEYEVRGRKIAYMAYDF